MLLMTLRICSMSYMYANQLPIMASADMLQCEQPTRELTGLALTAITSILLCEYTL